MIFDFATDRHHQHHHHPRVKFIAEQATWSLETANRLLHLQFNHHRKHLYRNPSIFYLTSNLSCITPRPPFMPCMYFGQYLENLKIWGQYRPHDTVPYFIRQSIDYLRSYLTKYETLRGGASSYDFNAVITTYQNGGPLQFTNVETPSRIVKIFLSELPNAVLPERVMVERKRAARSVNFWVEVLSSIESPLEYVLAYQMFCFFREVAEALDGKFTEIAAIVWIPLMKYELRLPTLPNRRQTMAETSFAVSFLLTNLVQIWPRVEEARQNRLAQARAQARAQAPAPYY